MLPVLAIIGGLSAIIWAGNEVSRRNVDERVKTLPRGQWAREIARRDSWICGICRKKIKSLKELEIDHIQPVSLGGEDDPSNLRATHWWCNVSRSNRYDLRDKLAKMSREL